jgi:topoisomerase-4 subunit A
VIRIIREEDDAKGELIRAFKLTDVQADAILNMRLRHLRKLEEMEIRAEHDNLTQERKEIIALLKDEKARWEVITAELKDLRNTFGPDTELGRRRTEIGGPPSAVIIPLEAMVEREPVTVICSIKGWVRAIRGHIENEDELKFKEGDRHRFALHAQTTDKLLVFATNGRFYTLGVDKLPGGRGHGEPLRLMLDLPQEHDIAGLSIYRPQQKILIVASDGRGFVVNEDDLIAQTRNGRQVLNISGGTEAKISFPMQESHDHVAVVGENRKLLIFPLADLPEMSRGRGNILQRYKDGGLDDAKTFKLEGGLTWKLGDRTRTDMDILRYIGKRAGAGMMAPRGFPRNNKFG